MKQRRTLILLGLCVVLFLALGYAILGGTKAKNYPAYWSDSADLDGTKALRLLLGGKATSVKAWTQPWNRLPEREEQTLLIIEPGSLKEKEWEELTAWIESGHDVILFQSAPSGFTVPELSSGGTGVQAVRRQDTGETYRAELTNPNRLTEAPDWRPLLTDAAGETVAAERTIGEGRLQVFVTPDWLMNDRVLREGHFELVWPYLSSSRGTVWIDEYHHGLRSKPGLAAVYPGWLLLAFVQLALALLLWLWMKGKRFGPVYTPREWVMRRGDETMLAIAGWYERSGRAREAMLLQGESLRRRFEERWGVGRRADSEELLRAAGLRWPAEDVRKLEALLRRLEELKQDEGSPYSSKRFAQDSHSAEWLTKRLDKE